MTETYTVESNTPESLSGIELEKYLIREEYSRGCDLLLEKATKAQALLYTDLEKRIIADGGIESDELSLRFLCRGKYLGKPFFNFKDADSDITFQVRVAGFDDIHDSDEKIDKETLTKAYDILQAGITDHVTSSGFMTLKPVLSGHGELQMFEAFVEYTDD